MNRHSYLRVLHSLFSISNIQESLNYAKNLLSDTYRFTLASCDRLRPQGDNDRKRADFIWRDNRDG